MPEPVSIDELLGAAEWPVVHSHGRSFVVYKVATTLDGRVSAADGSSRWITSAESRAEVHLLRAGCQATVVGSGTQQADDPRLGVRRRDDVRFADLEITRERQPWRVVVDTNARTPADARVLNEDAPTLIAVAPDADAAHLEGRATVVRVPRATGGLDLHVVLRELLARDVRAVLLEGGPTLAGSLLAEGLIDRVINYLAPAFLGAGKTALGDAGVGTIADIKRLEVVDLARSGPDIRIVARPISSSAAPDVRVP